MFALLLEWSIIFQVLIFFVSVILFSTDKLIGSGILFYALLAGTIYLSPQISDFLLSGNNWLDIVSVISAFIVLGLITTFIKWVLYAQGVASEIIKIRSKITDNERNDILSKFGGQLTEYGILGFIIKQHAERRYTWNPNLNKLLQINPYLSDSDLEKVENATQLSNLLSPVVERHRNVILTWFIQWPLVVCDLIFNKLIHKIFTIITDLFSGVYAWLADIFIRPAVK